MIIFYKFYLIIRCCSYLVDLIVPTLSLSHTHTHKLIHQAQSFFMRSLYPAQHSAHHRPLEDVYRTKDIMKE